MSSNDERAASPAREMDSALDSEHEDDQMEENNPLVDNKDEDYVESKENEEVHTERSTEDKSVMHTIEGKLAKLLDTTHEYALQMRQKSSSDGSARRRRKADEEETTDTLEADNVVHRLDPQGQHEFVRKEVVGDDGETTYLHMRSYQVEAVNWLIQLHELGINGILADEMGLGKTLETIAFLGYLKKFRKNKKKHMIIVPLSTSNNWVREFQTWSQDLNVFLFYGNQEERERLKNTRLKSKDWDVLVTSYEVAMIEKAALRKIKPWGYIVIDEAHRVKNRDSKLSKDVRLFQSDHRLLLTGTPLQNNMRELWSLLNFLLPDLFDSHEVFSDTFSLSNMENDSGVANKLHRILQPFLLRRLKKDVTKDLPPKVEIALYCGLSMMQKWWYRNLLERNIASINERTGGTSGMQNILMQLRKVCNHPYIFPGAEQANEDGEYQEGEHLIDNCGKMVILDRLLKKLKEQDSRVLIFSQMTFMLDILEDYVRMRGYEYCRIDGSTPQVERDEEMETFNARGSSKFVFLLSTRAGGLGINLQTADTVILYDSDWNPHMDLQAQDRAHRIGQKKPVHVYRFITEDTIEERILDRAMKKLYLDAVVVQKGQLTKKNPKLKREDLQSMVRFGADFILKNPESTITDDDIEDILAAGKQKFDELQSNLREAFDHNVMDFSLDVNNEKKMQEFEGKDYSGFRALRDQQSRMLVIDRGPRQRKVTSYSEDAYFREALTAKTPATDKRTSFRPFKSGSRPAFQFYDSERLEELEKKAYDAKETLRVGLINGRSDLKKEFAERKRQARLKQRQETARLAKLRREMRNSDASALIEESATPELEDEEDEETEWARRKEELEASIDFLTREEEREMNKLRSKGFGNWRAREFQQFVRALCDFGKDVDKVEDAVDGKTPEEVRAYFKVFWRKFKTLPDHKRIKKKMDDAEENRQQFAIYTDLLKKKLSRADGNPLDTVRIPYDLEGKKLGLGNFSMDCDRFLLVSMKDFGFNSFDEVKKQLLLSPRFRFDWYIRSRNPRELKSRAMRLLKQLEAEQEWKDERKAEKAKEEKRQKRKDQRSASTSKSKSKSASVSAKKRGRKRKSSESVETSEDSNPKPSKRRRTNAKKEQELIAKLPPGTIIRYLSNRCYHRAEVIAYTGEYEFNIRDVSANENEPIWCANLAKMKWKVVNDSKEGTADTISQSPGSSATPMSSGGANGGGSETIDSSDLISPDTSDDIEESEDVSMSDVSQTTDSAISASVLGKRSRESSSSASPGKRKRRRRENANASSTES